MAKLPADLPQRLRAAGLKVVVVDGWLSRGRPGSFNPVGVLNHHTGSKDVYDDLADDLAYARWMFREGRNDLPAPLCQMALSLEGTVYVGAAGRANHGGTAKSSGSVAAGNANSLYYGIEWMLSGTQKIPARMYEAAATLNAVLLDILGSSVQAVSCHYQTSVTGKWDIGDPDGIPFKGTRVLDVPKFRRAVQAASDRLDKPTAPKPDKGVDMPEPAPAAKLTRGASVEATLDAIDTAQATLSGAKPSKGNARLVEAARDHLADAEAALRKIEPFPGKA